MKTKATKAYKLMDEAIHVMSQGVIIYDSFTVVMTDDVEEIIDIAFKEGQSNPQIKELEWTKNEYGLHWVTNNPFRFQATISEFNVRCSLRLPNQDFVTYYKNLDEAKQACQEDFNRRIKECLL